MCKAEHPDCYQRTSACKETSASITGVFLYTMVSLVIRWKEDAMAFYSDKPARYGWEDVENYLAQQETTRQINEEARIENEKHRIRTLEQTVERIVEDASETVINDPRFYEKVDEWFEGKAAQINENTDAINQEVIARSSEDVSLSNLIDDSKASRIYFPDMSDGEYSGASSLLVARNKTILFDAQGYQTHDNVTALVAYYDDLERRGILTNIDIIVISHFHWDHIEGLDTILTRYKHDNCIAYIPMGIDGYSTQSWVQDIQSNESNVKSILAKHDVEIIQVYEDTKVNINSECSLDLFNSSPEDYSYYKENTQYYNDYSMCCIVNSGDNKAMFPGDIQRAAQERIFLSKDTGKIDLYCVHHHGIQNDDFVPYLNMIDPAFSVIPTNYTRGLESAVSSFAANYFNGKIYSTGYSDVIFAIGSNGVSCVKGTELEKCGYVYSYVDLYVNNKYSGKIKDGTKEHPFTKIFEALMFVRQHGNLRYAINIEPSSDPYGYLFVRNFTDVTVEIKSADSDNKATIPGMYIDNCSSIIIRNLSVLGNGYNSSGRIALFHIKRSRVSIYDCDISGDGTQTNLEGMCLEGSDVHVNECNFRDMNDGIRRTNHISKLSSEKLTFTNVNYCYGASGLHVTIAGNDIVSNAINYIVGGVPSGIPVSICAQNSTTIETMKNLFKMNTASVSSSPFYVTGYGPCVLIGTDIVPIKQEDNLDFIPDGTNLNTINSPGVYICQNTASSKTMVNCPHSTSGFRLVYEHTASSISNASKFGRQTIYANSGTNPRIYTRTMTSGNYGPWYEIQLNEVV